MRELTADTLSHLDDKEKQAELAALVASARQANGHTTQQLKARVRQYELRYEMTTSELLKELAKGTQKETAEIADWLFWYDALEAQNA